MWRRCSGLLPSPGCSTAAGAGPDFAREQMLRLASRIVQDQQNNRSRIFAFTSVKARGGTSSIVMETAAAIGRLGRLGACCGSQCLPGGSPLSRFELARSDLRLARQSGYRSTRLCPARGEMPDHVPLGDLSGQKHLPDIQKLIEILRASAGLLTRSC